LNQAYNKLTYKIRKQLDKEQSSPSNQDEESNILDDLDSSKGAALSSIRQSKEFVKSEESKGRFMKLSDQDMLQLIQEEINQKADASVQSIKSSVHEKLYS
jgi:hypothetical protein